MDIHFGSLTINQGIRALNKKNRGVDTFISRSEFSLPDAKIFSYKWSIAFESNE